MTAQELRKLIQSYDYVYHNETELQDQIEIVLKDGNILYSREHRLDDKSRIDFYLPDGKIGIEIKVKSGANVVSEQLARYAHSDQIKCLILITSRMAHVQLQGTMYGRVMLETIFIGGF
jgi:hypothetical protein